MRVSSKNFSDANELSKNLLKEKRRTPLPLIREFLKKKSSSSDTHDTESLGITYQSDNSVSQRNSMSYDDASTKLSRGNTIFSQYTTSELSEISDITDSPRLEHFTTKVQGGASDVPWDLERNGSITDQSLGLSIVSFDQNIVSQDNPLVQVDIKPFTRKPFPMIESFLKNKSRVS